MEPIETLVWFGGACKALDDKGQVGGYLVLFGSPDQTDASSLRDYFTPDTDFDLDSASAKSRLLYHHGLDPTIGNKKIGLTPANLKADDAGIWAQAQLDLRDKYERRLWAMVKEGKMGWSSGTVSHLIRREKQDNGSHKILAWPLGLDASITPSPAEPRTQAVALKSLVDEASKSAHLGPTAEPAAAMAAVRTLHERLHEATWGHLGDEKSLASDRMKRISDAYDECKSLSMKCMKALLGGDDEPAEEEDADAEDLGLIDRIGATLIRTMNLDE